MKKIYSYAAIASLMMMLCFTEAGWGQTSIGPLYPGTGVNVDGPGTESWTNPGYIAADDVDFASVWLPNTETTTFTSELLQGSNYGFSIPAGATINGIQVRIMRQSSDYNPDGIGIFDASLNLLKGGIIAGENRASAAIWSEDMTEVLYGGVSDLWGTTWSAEDINNSNFGASFSVTQNGTGDRTAYIDYISITVTFTAPPPTVLPGFPGIGANADGPGTELWINPEYITADDESYAYVTLPNTETASFTSEYLRGTNYGFAIPTGATINGIQVKIMRQSSDYNPDGVGIYDAGLNLLKAGSIAGNNHANASIWQEDMTEITYGGEYDLWGTTWTAEEINNSNFGVSFSVTQNGTGDREAYVDYISVTVYFTVTPPAIAPGLPGTGANVDGPGTEPWINPEYITADDVNYASVTLPNTESTTYTSEFLQGNNYGFTIPTGATINGIQVKIMRQSSDYNLDGIGIYDVSLNLLKTGIIAGNNLANAGIWSEDMTEVTYGGEYDLWGTTWSAADINNSNFGASFSVTQNGTGGRIAYVDYISITVYYTVLPSLSVNPAGLSFGFVTSGENSTEQVFQLSGTNFPLYSGTITITAPSTDFQVSNDNISWGSVTTVAYDSYTLAPTDVYVRFTPQTLGVKSGNLALSGGGVASPPVVALTGTGIAPPASGDYRSASSTGGTWSDVATWEYFNGTSWVVATKSPESTDNIITIRNSNTVYVDVAVTVDQVMVESGGQVIMTSDINIVNGPGDDFTVYGILSRAVGEINNTGGTLVFGDGGTYQHALNGSSIPVATWSANSNCNITGVGNNAPSGLNQNFGNFNWECSSQLLTVHLNSDMTINGDFTVASTGGSNNELRGLRMSGGTTGYTIQVAGDFNVISPATFKMNSSSGSCTLNIGGDLNIAGSSTGSTGFYLNSYNGTASATVNIAGNLNVLSGYLIFSNDGGGAGAIATLNLSGNFNHTGGYIQNSSTGAGYIGTINFAGAEIQTFNSTGITANHIINFNVNEGAYLQMGTPATTVTGAGTFTLSDGATLGITSPAGITSSGATGNIQTAVRSFSAEAKYIYNGTAAQNTGNGLPLTIKSLVFDNSGGVVTFNGVRTITDNFSITAGSKANLGTGLEHSTVSLTFGGIEQAGGTYGHSISPATYKNNVYFDSATGVVNNQINSWVGITTDWNSTSNWSAGVVPTTETNALITPSSANQPVITGPTLAVCNILQINPGASLTISPSGNATFMTLSNTGTLNLNSTSSSDIFSLKIDGTYSGSGTTNAQLFLTGGGGPAYNWHYVAVPFFDGLNKSFFTNVNATNLLAYDNSRVQTSDFQGWSWHDGHSSQGLVADGGFTTLLYGKGYNFYHSSASATVTLTANTLLGSTLSTAALQYAGSGDNAIRGYNLLGNSLTCSINWDEVTFSGSTNETLYFTTNNQWVSYIEGGGGTNGGSPYIPPLQGFFVKADAGDATVSFPAVSKVHSTQARYKKSGTEQAETKEKIVFPKVKLELNGTETSDETIVWFNDEATTGYDQKYDGYKLFSSGAAFSQLYSTLGGRNYVINGITLPTDSIIVPLGVKIAQAGNYSILKKVLEELDNYDVCLIDKANGNYTVDLKKSDKYTFSSDAGTFTDRFILKFTSLTTSAEVPSITNKTFNIYSTRGNINILPPEDFAGGSDFIVRIYDLTGRIVKQANNIDLYGGSLLQVPFTGRQGVYIVEIISGLSRYRVKVSVK